MNFEKELNSLREQVEQPEPRPEITRAELDAHLRRMLLSSLDLDDGYSVPAEITALDDTDFLQYVSLVCGRALREPANVKIITDGKLHNKRFCWLWNWFNRLQEPERSEHFTRLLAGDDFTSANDRKWLEQSGMKAEDWDSFMRPELFPGEAKV